jgi:glucose-1-phosphate cytidylyltransferase
MQVVILAGGYGSRLLEETSRIPKPMVEVGGRPLLWHIMKIYDSCGFRDFIIACGYKGAVIKDYFDRFGALNSDWTVNLSDGTRRLKTGGLPNWNVSLIDTGLDTMTGGRLRRLKPHITGDYFLATYGDGVANIDLAKLVAFHESHGRAATVTAVRPPARFGSLSIENDLVTEFSEKEQSREGWINGGFLVLTRSVLDRIAGDSSSLEYDLLRDLARDKQLAAYRHEGFWHPMDTLRDRQQLEHHWASGAAPWKMWRD